jgi:hypothetical protein
MITRYGTGCGCRVTVCRPVQVSQGISARTRVPPVARVSTRKLPRTAEKRSSSPRRPEPRLASAPPMVRSLRPKILERELLTERQLDELDRAARAHIEDPRTVMLPMLYFTAWGRKPG